MSVLGNPLFDPSDLKDIHQLDTAQLLSGKEWLVVDDETVTKKISLDSLLGVFAQRLSGDDSDMIDINKLAAASCIHIIPYGGVIPDDRKIDGHYYIRLTDAVSKSVMERATFLTSDSVYLAFETAKEAVVDLIHPNTSYALDESITHVKIASISVGNTDASITDRFSVTKCHGETSETFDFEIKSNYIRGDFVNTKVTVLNAVGYEVLVSRVNDKKLDIWVECRGCKSLHVFHMLSISAPESSGLPVLAANLFDYTCDLTEDTSSNKLTSELFVANIIARSESSMKAIADEIDIIEKSITKVQLDPVFNSVSFDLMPSEQNIKDILFPTHIDYYDKDDVFLKLKPDGSIEVQSDGFYQLALKQGFLIYAGDATVELSVHINEALIKDLDAKLKLSATFSMPSVTGIVSLRLNKGDVIKVMYKLNGTIGGVNYSALQITKVMDIIEPVSFGNIGQELLNIGSLGQAGSANLYANMLGDFNDDDDTSVYEYPFVEKAKVDKSSLVEPKE